MPAPAAARYQPLQSVRRRQPAARAARAETYPGQRSAGRLGAMRRPVVAPAGLHPGKQPARVDISAFAAHGHLRPGVALLLAGVLGMLLAVSEALGRRDAAAERGAEIAGSDPRCGAAQSRWCRRQNPPSQAACGSQGRAT